MNIKRAFKWKRCGMEYMSLVFKLDMCTCGGKAPERLYQLVDGISLVSSSSLVVSFSKKNFNNSFVFPVECYEWSLGRVERERYYKKFIIV
jgi:hypothetical protein